MEAERELLGATDWSAGAGQWTSGVGGACS